MGSEQQHPQRREGEGRPLPLTERHPTIWWVLTRFQLALDAYREMLDKAVPNIHELDQQRFGANELAAIKTLPEENRQRLEAFIEHHIHPDTPAIDLEDEEQKSAIFGELGEIFRGDRYAATSFHLHMNEVAAGPRRVAIVQNSLLVMAISAFEVLLSGLISRQFVMFPDALQADQREFSLEDVRGFQSEEDAIDLLLSRRVTKIMYGSLDDWSKWFEDRCNARFADLAIAWESLREAFQRRHVIMHSGGRVSSEYLAKVRVGTPPTLGSQLNVDADYLQQLLDQLDALGTGVAVRAWGTWFPAERDEAAGRLLRRTYQTMISGRWAVTEKLAELADLKCSEDLRHSIRCNGWLSRAERSGYDAVHSEVEAWDASALSGRFRLVRLVLLQRLEAALELVPALIASEEVSRGELREWPILRTLREHQGYPAVAEAQGI
jgi:hypothetical protein